MGTTAQKLNKILETKEAIRTAINNKGGTLTTTDTFASYPSAIDSLPSGGGDPLKEYLDEAKSASFMFSGRMGTNGEYTTWYYNLTYERLQKLLKYETTSSVTKMNGMFYYCNALTTIPLFDTSLVTTIANMFAYCSNLTNFPQLDTSKVTNMINTFGYCSKLKTIKLDTSSCTDMSRTFQYCKLLETIDINYLNIPLIGNTYYFAYSCHSLTKVIIRNMPTIYAIHDYAFSNCYHFTGTTNATYNPQGLKDGRIYVPDDKVETLKTTNGWREYADIIVGLSTLQE